MLKRQVLIQCDGSCIENGLPGAKSGAAIVILEGDAMIYHGICKPSGDKHTSNRAELVAFYMALEFLYKNPSFAAVIECDSKTTYDGVLGVARRKANRDLWQLIEDIMPIVYGQVIEVRGIISENNMADKYACQASNALFINQEANWAEIMEAV